MSQGRRDAMAEHRRQGKRAVAPCVPPAQVGPVLAARGRALVVDDCFSIARVHCRLLASAGMRADVAANGVEAASLVLVARDQGDPFDLVLMDLDMPVMGGLEAAEAMRACGYIGALVAVSGTADLDAGDHCARAGFDDFVAKPATADELFGAIDAAFAHRRRLRHLSMFVAGIAWSQTACRSA